MQINAETRRNAQCDDRCVDSPIDYWASSVEHGTVEIYLPKYPVEPGEHKDGLISLLRAAGGRKWHGHGTKNMRSRML